MTERLSPEQIREAARTLRNYLRPGTPLHALTSDEVEYWDDFRPAMSGVFDAALAYTDVLETMLLVPKDAPSILVPDEWWLVENRALWVQIPSHRPAGVYRLTEPLSQPTGFPSHQFVGRLDRWCEICNRPDRNLIHQQEEKR